MRNVHAKYSENLDFYKGNDPFSLVKEYGSPLYVYNEAIIVNNIKLLKNLVTYENFKVLFSAKANSSLALLQIACREGIDVDAMSPGEIYSQLEAGFTPDRIFYVCNNVSKEEMQFAIDKGVKISVDSVSQLRSYGEINPGGKVALRFNGGVGAGHHEKVVTAGKNTKFGINPESIDECKSIIKEHSLKLIGINQHIGSLFLDPESYIAGVRSLLEIAMQFDDLEFVDFGGGFGVAYRRNEGETPLDFEKLGRMLDEEFEAFAKKYGKRVTMHIEPGRFVVCESSILLGTVHSIKTNVKKYIGTDIGFNVLIRPAMYDSFHDIEIYRDGGKESGKNEDVTIVGNICESGDILAKDRNLPEIFENDILGVLDAGAYGHAMSSNYNNRLRPAEVLIRENGEAVLIRKRDSFEDLMRNYIKI